MDQQIFFRYPKLWNYVNTMLLQEVVFDSNQNSKILSDPIDVNSFIDTNKIKQQF